MTELRLRSTTDEQFLRTVQHWLESESEILIFFRYSRSAGSKSFEFVTSFDHFLQRLKELTPETAVTVFRKRQLPLRAVVDDEFIRECLDSLKPGAEFLVVETVPRTAGQQLWFHHEAGESHGELQETLEGLRGRHVAVGLYPPWQTNGQEVLSAYVPSPDGKVTAGVY